jgi:hypothetical protein
MERKTPTATATDDAISDVGVGLATWLRTSSFHRLPQSMMMNPTFCRRDAADKYDNRIPAICGLTLQNKGIYKI